MKIYQCLDCQFFTTSTDTIVEHRSICKTENQDIPDRILQPVTMVPTIGIALFSTVDPTESIVISTNKDQSDIAANSTSNSINAATSVTSGLASSMDLLPQNFTPVDCSSMFTISESGLKEYRCPNCPHVTNRAHALSKHINSMHTKAVWFHCEYCQYRCTDKSSLRRHIRNVHGHGGSMNKLTCKQCGYHCSSEYNLQRHHLKHESDILQCPFCSYSSKDRSNFRKHLFIHNQTEYSCKFCKYSCYSPYQLKLHLKNKHQSVGIDDVDCRSETPLDMLVDEISKCLNDADHNLIGNIVE